VKPISRKLLAAKQGIQKLVGACGIDPMQISANNHNKEDIDHFSIREEHIVGQELIATKLNTRKKQCFWLVFFFFSL